MEHAKDTPAWIFQTWASFIIAVASTSIGIWYLPVTIWVQGFLAMGFLFSIGSSFTLAKTIRDNHESKKLVNRLEEAKAERLIHKYSDAA